MTLDDLLAESQAEPVALHVTFECLFGAKELLEDLAVMGGFDAWALILEPQAESIAAIFDADPELPARAVVFDGIAQQVVGRHALN